MNGMIDLACSKIAAHFFVFKNVVISSSLFSNYSQLFTHIIQVASTKWQQLKDHSLHAQGQPRLLKEVQASHVCSEVGPCLTTLHQKKKKKSPAITLGQGLGLVIGCLPGVFTVLHLYHQQHWLQKRIVSRQGCSNGSSIKNAYCSYWGPTISSQHPHDCLQLSLTSVSRGSVPSSGLSRHHILLQWASDVQAEQSYTK